MIADNCTVVKARLVPVGVAKVDGDVAVQKTDNGNQGFDERLGLISVMDGLGADLDADGAVCPFGGRCAFGVFGSVAKRFAFKATNFSHLSRYITVR